MFTTSTFDDDEGLDPDSMPGLMSPEEIERDNALYRDQEDEEEDEIKTYKEDEVIKILAGMGLEMGKKQRINREDL